MIMSSFIYYNKLWNILSRVYSHSNKWAQGLHIHLLKLLKLEDYLLALLTLRSLIFHMWTPNFKQSYLAHYEVLCLKSSKSSSSKHSYWDCPIPPKAQPRLKGPYWASLSAKHGLFELHRSYMLPLLANQVKCDPIYNQLILQMHRLNKLNTLILLKIKIKVRDMDAFGCQYIYTHTMYFDHQYLVRVYSYFSVHIIQCIW